MTTSIVNSPTDQVPGQHVSERNQHYSSVRKFLWSSSLSQSPKKLMIPNVSPFVVYANETFTRDTMVATKTILLSSFQGFSLFLYSSLHKLSNHDSSSKKWSKTLNQEEDIKWQEKRSLIERFFSETCVRPNKLLVFVKTLFISLFSPLSFF